MAGFSHGKPRSPFDNNGPGHESPSVPILGGKKPGNRAPICEPWRIVLANGTPVDVNAEIRFTEHKTVLFFGPDGKLMFWAPNESLAFIARRDMIVEKDAPQQGAEQAPPAADMPKEL